MRPAEIRARARRLGLQVSVIENDYVLNHVLAAIAETAAPLAFHGGTALARAYWPDFRLSEDLDFITDAAASDIERPLRDGVRTSAARTGLALELDLTRPAEGWTRSTVRWDDRAIVLDVNRGERAYLPVERRTLDLPYSDLRDADREMEVVALEEILGNKWYMLDDRQEPRDLFDLWAGLCRFGVPFELVAQGYRAKYGSLPGLWRLERAARLEADWELRLAYQVQDLPTFDEAHTAVRGKFEEWAEGR